MKIYSRITSLVLAIILTLPTAFAAGAGTGEAVYSHTVELQSGFYYKNEISFNSSGNRVETYKLDLRAGSEIKPIVLSADKIMNAMYIDEVTAFANDLGYTVFGAVNADFFSMQTYVPLGIVIENGIYKSSPSLNNALIFTDEGAAVVEKAAVQMRFSNSRSGQELILNDLNKARHEQFGIYVFTSAYSETTETFTEGWAVRCKIKSGEMRIGTSLELEVTEIVEKGMNFTIADDELILSASLAGTIPEGYKDFAVGDSLTLDLETEDERLASAKWATGCGDILVSEGELTDDKTWDSALFGLNPRTAVGIREDGTIITYTVDGRNSAHSVGARMSDVAKDLIDEGCVTVVNLDGGGSTAVNVKLAGYDAAKTVDEPSSIRRCSTYILFVSEKKPSGVSSKQFLAEDGAFVLSGAKTTLHYFFTDELLNKTADGQNVSAVAPSTAGAFKAPNGGIVYVVSPEECDIEIINADIDKTASLTDMESGSSVQLSVCARKLGRDVLFDSDGVVYTASGCAQTDESGLVTVIGGAGDTGTVTVKLAGYSKTLDVNIPLHFEDTRYHWSKEFIESIYREGIVNGYPDGDFHPDDTMTRGNFALMLYRAMGSESVSGDAPFADVTPDVYYHDAVLWAKNTGCLVIRDETNYEPNADISREEAFTMLARALKLKSTDLSALNAFADSDEISEFALDSVAALVERGIVAGSGGTVFPKNTITRGEMAKIISLAMFRKQK